ncbi:MAG: glycogen phosphorylase [Clostridiales bacterium]|nr:MAG: glycogen phosphorylase [Clostridiales bacterium]
MSKITPRFEEILTARHHKTPEEAEVHQLHNALAAAVMEEIAPDWRRCEQARLRQKKACYFSAEFLVGRAIYNNLLCLGLTEQVEALFAKHGRTLSELEEIEDAALGNGGLGRLAACYLDSGAALSLPLDGYGIRYRYGLFRQSFEDGFQKEQADDWTRFGDPWSIRREDEAVEVAFKGLTVRAVPYDMPILGYRNGYVSTLRLWQAEPLQPFDFALFNEQKYARSVQQKNRAEDISRVLYPNDDTNAGKRLRLKQQYFFCCASLTDLLRKYTAVHGEDFSKFAEMYAIQLNDTHPTISIPELIRQLVDLHGVPFAKAFSIARETFAYTNHTIMAEALEQWDASLMRSVVPRIAEIIAEIDRVFRAELRQKGVPEEQIERMGLIRNKRVQMAHLAVYASHCVNGVAAIHTEILKKETLQDWYQLYPERFQNKTNGITQRRWLALCNPELAALCGELLGSDAFLTDLSKLQPLAAYADDGAVLERFLKIKTEKKRQLAAFIQKREGVALNPDAIFDVQIKRLHEYKRQLLNAFSIMAIYLGIKDGSIQDFHPTTFLFGAKAAPGYFRAKAVIKYINELAKLIDSDPDVNGLIRVVFVQNYDVSYAEKLVAGADISEQISTAGTEASGTGNMKLMLNGTVTLGTLDGANIEIVEEAGAENNYIFGLTVEELDTMRASYDPNALYQNDPLIRRVVDTLVDGTLSDGGTGMFRELYGALLKGASWHKPDHYFLLADLKPYLEAKLRVNRDYADRKAFARKGWLNLCHAGKFSSDRAIHEYAAEIWGIQPVE